MNSTLSTDRQREARYAAIQRKLKALLPEAGSVAVTHASRIRISDRSSSCMVGADVDGSIVFATERSFDAAIKNIATGYLSDVAANRKARATVLPPVEDAPTPQPEPIFELLGNILNPCHSFNQLNQLNQKKQ